MQKNFQRLSEKGLILNFDKCLFSKETLEYFGFIFLKNILGLKAAKRPRDNKGVSSYLGMINYIKCFIPDFCMLTYPIRKLTHQDLKFEWSDDCEKSFQTLNNYLTEKAVSIYSDEKKLTVIYCYASPVKLSSILLQKDENDNAHVISYSYHSLTTTEQKYSQIERECLSLVYTCKRHHIYVLI